MKHKREKSKCRSCPLRDRTRVWGDGWEKAKLAVIGEAPGREEDQEGRPFVGASGRFFTWAMAQAGAMRSKLWITNVLSCRPPGNNISSPEAGEALENCAPGFQEELEGLKSRGVTTLLLLGATALERFNIPGSLTKIRGSVYQAQGFTIVPTFHPSYLIRMGYTKAGAAVDFTSTWIADLKKAVSAAENGWRPPREKFTLFPSWEDLETFRVSSQGKPLAVDIEVEGGQNPGYNQIIMIGMAYDEENALVVPIVDQKQNPYWPNGKFQKMKSWVNEMFSTHRLVFQNALYDVLILRQHGYKIDMSLVGDDIMLAHHALSPESPHDLGFISSIYGKTPYHKATLKESSGILSLDDTTARTYNARDCVIPLQILPQLRDDLLESGTEAIYTSQSLPLLGPLLEAKETGILLDRDKLASYKRKLKKKIKALEGELREVAQLPSGFNLDSDDDLRWLIFGQRPGKFEKLSQLEDFTEKLQLRYRCSACGSTRWYWADGWEKSCGKCGETNALTLKEERYKSKRSKDSKTYQDLLDIQAISEIFPFSLPPGFNRRSTETGKVAVNEQSRLSLLREINRRLEAIAGMKNPKLQEAAQLEKLKNFLYLYNQFSAVGKLLSTYTHYPTWPDGRVHPSMLIHGTSTGRLACREPNLQNIPKRAGIEAREPFTASPGFVLLSRDYTNLEVFILAYITEDEPLIEFLEAGGNLHDKNTTDLFGFTPEDPQWKSARACEKIFQFGGIQYAGGDREIFERMLLSAPQLNLTFADYQRAKRNYLSVHPAYAVWKEQTISQAKATRESITALGRKRILTGRARDLEKEALNTPIQGTAADIINLALIRIWRRKIHHALQTRFLLQIHDELIWEVPEGELELFDSWLKEEMERPVEITGKHRRFRTTRAVGENLGALQEQED